MTFWFIVSSISSLETIHIFTHFSAYYTKLSWTVVEFISGSYILLVLLQTCKMLKQVQHDRIEKETQTSKTVKSGLYVSKLELFEVYQRVDRRTQTV